MELLDFSKGSFQKSEAFQVGALLAVAGGILDAYTYLCRGGVFANAETGNIVLFGVYLAQRQWQKAVTYLFPILAFFTGVLVAEWIKHLHRHSGRYHWRHTVLLVEIGTVAAASFIPRGRPDPAVNMMVSFICAMQVETFRKVRGNSFASTMCTGNLRSGTEALYHGVAEGNRDLLEKSACYYGIIACFILGAALGAVLSGIAPQRGVLAAAAFQLAAFGLMYEKDAKAT